MTDELSLGIVGSYFVRFARMNHFQRLNEGKELNIFFFVQRANTRKQASSRQPLPCDALAPTFQSRAGARCPNLTRQRCAQKTSSYITVSYVQSHHFPRLQPRALQSIRFPRLTAIRTHHPMSRVSLGEAHSRLQHTVFPPEGLLLSGQGGYICSR